MTPFRKSQIRTVLEGLVRFVAPDMEGKNGVQHLRAVVRELADDGPMWAEINQARAEPLEVHGVATMETSSLMKP